jgi:hypothetical protein
LRVRQREGFGQIPAHDRSVGFSGHRVKVVFKRRRRSIFVEFWVMLG